MRPFYDEKNHKIYTRELAATIVDIFDQLLYENEMSISSDDEDMDPNDNLGLQGDPYFDLLDRVEDLVIIALKEAQTKKIRTDEIVDILDGTERPSGNLPGIVEGRYQSYNKED